MSIPAAVLRLSNLKVLSIHDNPLETPPAEVSHKRVDAIRDYWRQRADTGVDYLCEAKLIILGEAGAGKTSLARKIQDPGYALREGEKSTEGIDVIRYHSPRRSGRARLAVRTSWYAIFRSTSGTSVGRRSTTPRTSSS